MLDSKQEVLPWKNLSAMPLILLCCMALLLMQGLPAGAEGVAVSGRVATSSGEGVAGVRIVLGGTTAYAMTNSNGEYSLPVAAAGTYNVGAFKDGFIFDPRYRSVTVGAENITGINFVAIPAFAIRGRIVNGSGEGVANVRVLRAATSSFPAGGALTNSNGEYALPPAPAGTYVVTPALEQTVFDPRSRSVTITNAAVTGINFTASPAYVLRGRIANSEGVAAPNVKVVIGPEPMPAPGTPVVLFYAYTDANGQFVSPLLRPNSYRLTPMKENLAFDPHYRTVTITNANIGDLNFRSIPAYTIGGRVATSSGEGIANVTLTLTGGRSVLTNSAGYYAFYSVVAGSYTVTPAKADTVFDPISRSVTIASTSVFGVNFIGVSSATAHSISGRVTNSSGAGVADVRIQRSGSTTAVFTNSEGNYVLPAVQAGTYTITPFKEGLVFDPRYRSVTVGDSNVTGVNFTALPAYRIGGRVTNSSGAGVASVKILLGRITSTSATPVPVADAFTNAEGNYLLPPVPAGNYVVAPAKEGLRFDPRSRNVTVSTANVTGINFTASPVYSIYGRVTTSAGVAIPNVRIRIDGTTISVLTNSAGYFGIPGLTPGTYTLIPGLSGYAFDPATRSVTITDGNVAGVAFIGTASTP